MPATTVSQGRCSGAMDFGYSGSQPRGRGVNQAAVIAIASFARYFAEPVLARHASSARDESNPAQKSFLIALPWDQARILADQGGAVANAGSEATPSSRESMPHIARCQALIIRSKSQDSSPVPAVARRRSSNTRACGPRGRCVIIAKGGDTKSSCSTPWRQTGDTADDPRTASRGVRTAPMALITGKEICSPGRTSTHVAYARRAPLPAL